MKDFLTDSVSQMSRKTFGDFAEQKAADYLQQVLPWNLEGVQLHFREGELDLVFGSPEGVEFVEVKARRSSHAGNVVEALTAQKLRKIWKAIAAYRQSSGDFRPGRLHFLAMEYKKGRGFGFDLFQVER